MDEAPSSWLPGGIPSNRLWAWLHVVPCCGREGLGEVEGAGRRSCRLSEGPGGAAEANDRGSRGGGVGE